MGQRVTAINHEEPSHFAARAKARLLVSDLEKRFDEVKTAEGEPAKLLQETKERISILKIRLEKGQMVDSVAAEINACETVLALLNSLQKV